MSRIYTAITYASDAVHLSQHRTGSPEEALRQHLGGLPDDDDDPRADAELRWLQAVVRAEEPVTLVAVAGCAGAWLWREGAVHRPAYTTYLVHTHEGGSDAF
jgi:hypothetical protein